MPLNKGLQPTTDSRAFVHSVAFWRRDSLQRRWRSALSIAAEAGSVGRREVVSSEGATRTLADLQIALAIPLEVVLQ